MNSPYSWAQLWCQDLNNRSVLILLCTNIVWIFWFSRWLHYFILLTWQVFGNYPLNGLGTQNASIHARCSSKFNVISLLLTGGSLHNQPWTVPLYITWKFDTVKRIPPSQIMFLVAFDDLTLNKSCMSVVFVLGRINNNYYYYKSIAIWIWQHRVILSWLGSKRHE